MKNKIFLRLLITFILIIPLVTGCDKNKSMVVLSSKPITKETFYPEKVFGKGQKINIGIYNPKAYKSSVIRLQVIKTGKYTHLGYTIEHARDIEIDKDQKYFLSNFHIYKTGYYVLRVFGHDDMAKPIVENDFWVR